MSAYDELARMGVQFRPLDRYPGEPSRSRRASPFSARFGSTIELLADELRHLDAKHVVVQIALEERDFRVDGMPRADRNAQHPGIVVAFDSMHGPLKFAVDTFWDWRDNLRAIALGMEALRKVDRYGVTKRGEQYTGWKALPMSTDPADSLTTREQARSYLEETYGGDLRRALFESHPDRGGDSGEFRRVVRAKELLEADAS